MSTREGFPELWGITEIAEYADQLAIEAGDPPGFAGKRVTTQRVNGWIISKRWPDTVAVLAMGAVYLAEEVAPYVEEHLQRARTRVVGSAVRAQVLNAKGTMTAKDAAAQFGVSERRVYKIWAGQ